MRALLDVNALIALLDAAHVHHDRAKDWFTSHNESGWASCPLTENGCLRVLTQPSYGGQFSLAGTAKRLREARSIGNHQFWADSVSLLDAPNINLANVHGPKQLTDVYLLALAAHNGGRLVTFDRRIPLPAVPTATSANLVML